MKKLLLAVAAVALIASAALPAKAELKCKRYDQNNICAELDFSAAPPKPYVRPTMKYEQMYKFMLDTARDVQAGDYFNCDYTARTCERGFAWHGERVFELISDEDRKTVVGHGACHVNSGRWESWVCWNFDTGYYVGVVNGGKQDGQMTVSDTYNWPRPIW
jgi:hypothetical protein